MAEEGKSLRCRIIILLDCSEQVERVQELFHYPSGHYVIGLLAAEGVQITVPEEVSTEHILAYAIQFLLRREPQSRRPLLAFERYLDVLLDLVRHSKQVLANFVSIVIEEH